MASETCDFCTDGNCLLCQLAAPTEIGISSSHGRSLLRCGKEVEDSPLDKVVSYGRWCPLCRKHYIDLYHHFNKKHPGQTVLK